jgi:hypothetical protein
MIKKLAAVSFVLVLGVTTLLADSNGPLDQVANVVSSDGVGETILFPVAGSVEGINGTFFRSEVTLANFKNEDQEVLVEFLEQGATVPFTAVRLTLEAGRFYYWENFVGTFLNRNGKLGSLRIRAVNTGSTVTDTTAQLNGFSRIYTEQPNGPGTSSMALAAIDETDLGSLGLAAAYVLGARQDAQYRTNVGIVNLATVDRVFLVEPKVTFGSNPAGFTVTVPARSMQQVKLPDGTFGGVAVKITPATEGPWSAYAASVDNQSGDGWISKAQYSTRQP